MPEAIAVMLVFGIVGALLLIVWVQARQASHRHPGRELAQLEQHLAWLEERSRHAEEHRWGDDMKHRHEVDLARTRRRIEEIRQRVEQKTKQPG